MANFAPRRIAYCQLFGTGLCRHNGIVQYDHLAELEARLDNLSTRILPALRFAKHVDREAFAELNELVAVLTRELGDAELVPRQLTGKLWFVFADALAEADHTRSPEEILHYAWNYEDKLRQLFGPRFSLSPPTPGNPRY